MNNCVLAFTVISLLKHAISLPVFPLHDPFESCSEAAVSAGCLQLTLHLHPTTIGNGYHFKVGRRPAVWCDVLCNYMQTLANCETE